jgi:hypothetical protein
LTKSSYVKLKITTAKSTRRKNAENVLKTEELKRSKADPSSARKLKKKSLETNKTINRRHPKKSSTNRWLRKLMKSRKVFFLEKSTVITRSELICGLRSKLIKRCLVNLSLTSL